MVGAKSTGVTYFSTVWGCWPLAKKKQGVRYSSGLSALTPFSW